MYNFLTNNKRHLMFIFIFIETLIIIYNVRWVEAMPGDCAFYWSLLTQFWGDGFNILAPDYVIQGNAKGYFLPMIQGIPYYLSMLIKTDQFKTFQVFNGLFFSWFLIYFLPAFARLVFNIRTELKYNIATYLLLSQLVLFFFAGYLFYPLSDFPSAITYFIAVYFLINAYNSIKLESKIKIIIFFALAGMFFSIANNIRSNYQYGAIALMFFISICSVFDKKIKMTFLGIFIVAVSYFAASLPQLYVNSMKYGGGHTSINVKNEAVVGTFINAYWLDRLESVMDAGGAYAILFSRDLNELKLPSTRQNQTFTDLIGYAISNPLHTIGNISIKIFHGVDLWSNNIYELDIFYDHPIFRNLNYICWFLFIIIFLMVKLNLRQYFLILLISSPSLIYALAFHTEPRYYLLLYLFGYMAISTLLLYNFNSIINTLKIDKFKRYSVLFSFICFILFMNIFHEHILTTSFVPIYSSKDAPVILKYKENINLDKTRLQFALDNLTLKTSSDVDYPVNSVPISLDHRKMYYLSFDADVIKKPNFFYIDFYADNYDSGDQDMHFSLIRGNHSYQTVVYSGITPKDNKALLRFVMGTNSDVVISNLKIYQTVNSINFQSKKDMIYTLKYKIEDTSSCNIIDANVYVNGKKRRVFSSYAQFWRKNYKAIFSVESDAMINILLNDKSKADCKITDIVITEQPKP